MSLLLESCSTRDLCIALGETEKSLNSLRDRMEDWLKLQPHLPHDASETRLEWFILNAKMNLERAKRKLDMYYTMRRLVPEFFTNRDPRGPSIASLRNVMQYAMLPKLGPGNCRTFIFRIIENDPDKICIWDATKYIFMVADIRMIEDRSAGENLVFDLAKLNVGHLMKLTPSLLKKCEVAATNAYAMTIKAVHFINAPPYVDRLVTLIKSVLSSKLAAKLKVYVHPAGNLESFHEFIPKSILPKDYGGDQSTMSELDAALRARVDDWRDWFLEHEKILVNEHLRPGPVIDQDMLFGFSGSFRKLEVD